MTAILVISFFAEGGNFERNIVFNHDAYSEGGAYSMGTREDLLNVLRPRRRCDVYFAGGSPHEHIPDGTADKERLEAMFFQGLHYFCSRVEERRAFIVVKSVHSKFFHLPIRLFILKYSISRKCEREIC